MLVADGTAGKREMGKNQNSAMMLRFLPQCFWEIPCYKKMHSTKFERKLNSGGRVQVWHMERVGFKNCEQWPKYALFHLL